MLLLSLALAESPTPVVDPFDEPDEADQFLVEEQIITVASRYAQTVRQAPAIVTVITDAEIRRHGYRSLGDVLRSVPGVYLSTSPESRTLAGFRGVTAPDNNKFLLLIDGVPWYDGIYTHAWLDEYVLLANVKQIEIIKGPGSAIYGTNAFAGVINVVTYDAQDLQGGFARVEGGSAFRKDMSVVAGNTLDLRGKDVSAMGYARWHDTVGDGLDTTPRGRRNVNGADPQTALNAGFHLRAGPWTLRYDHVDFEHTYFTQAQSSLTDVLLQSKDEYNLAYHNDFVALRYDWRPGNDLVVSPNLYLQQHDNPGLYGFIVGIGVEDDGEGNLSGELQTVLVETEKKTQRLGASVEYELRPAAGHVNVGGVGLELTRLVALWDDEYSSFSPDKVRSFSADPASVLDTYVYVQHTWTALYWLELTGGLRADYNFQAAYPFASPRLGVLLVPSDTLTAKLLYGRAFRAPTARELLVRVEADEEGNYPFTDGNPQLRPETIDTAEMELAWSPLPPLQLRGAAFTSVLGSTIDKGTAVNRYVNRGGVNVLGAELEARFRWDPVELSASYSYTRARVEDQELGSSGDVLAPTSLSNFPVYEFPPHMGHGRVTWELAEGLYVSGLVDAYSYRPRWEWGRSSGLGDGPRFALTHLALATDTLAGGKVRLDLSVHNLLNTDYDTLIYVDDVSALNSDGSAKYPEDLQGEGRAFNVGVEVGF